MRGRAWPWNVARGRALGALESRKGAEGDGACDAASSLAWHTHRSCETHSHLSHGQIDPHHRWQALVYQSPSLSWIYSSFSFGNYRLLTYARSHTQRINTSPDHWPLLNCTSNPLQDISEQDSCSPQLWQKNSTWDGSCLPLLPCPPSYCIQLLAGLGDIYGSCDNPKASSSCHGPSTAALSYELSLFELLSRWCRVSGIRSTEWVL